VEPFKLRLVNKGHAAQRLLTHSSASEAQSSSWSWHNCTIQHLQLVNGDILKFQQGLVCLRFWKPQTVRAAVNSC
jgi:hypothetical protein